MATEIDAEGRAKGSEDLATFLLWVAESYEQHAKMPDVHPEEYDAYMGSANMARAHLAKLTLSTPASDDQVEAAAIAIHNDRLNGQVAWADVGPGHKNRYRSYARAALLAAMGSTKK